jgi:hypothetical protein
MAAGVGGLRIKKGAVGVLKETTAYTWNKPAVGDTFAAFDISVDMSGENYQRQETAQVFGKAADVPGMAEGTISFKLVATGGTAVATAPHYKNALAGCGFLQTTTPTTGPVTYKPVVLFDGSTPSNQIYPSLAYSVAVWEDGVLHGLKGAFGTCKLSAQAGQPAIWEFTFKGAYQAYSDEAVPAYTPSTLVPGSFLSASFLIDSHSAIFTNFSLDLGNDLQQLVNAQDASGIRGYACVDRRPTFSFDPELEKAALYNFFAKWRGGNTLALSWGPVGSGAGNILSFSATRTQLRAPKLNTRSGIRSTDIEGSIFSAGVDGDDFTITFA